MNIIGLTGPARAGKDTVAQILRVQHPGHVIRQGFADKLKQSVWTIFSPDPGPAEVPEALRFCDLLKTYGTVTVTLKADNTEATETLDGRTFLQRYGTEAHREVFGEDFWLDAVLPIDRVDITNVQGDKKQTPFCGRNDCDLLVIPDVRFDNEALRVLDCGGEVWEVIRPGVEGVNAHASETGVAGNLITRRIYNSGSIADLQQTVSEAARETFIEMTAA